MDKTEKKELNQKYKSDFEQLRKLVNSFDPISLIVVGAPEDEYDCLTGKILSYVYNQKTKIEMTNMVRHEIENHFGLVIEEEFKEKFNIESEKFIDSIYGYFEQYENKTHNS